MEDEDLKAAGGSTFSPAVMILMVVLLLVGLGLGVVIANTMNSREVYNARSEDAARIQKALAPKVENIKKAKDIVAKMSPTPSDYEKVVERVEKLDALELAPEGNVLGGNRLLLGPEVIDYVTNFMVDAATLQQLIDEHKRLTTGADKDELKQLMENNEVLKKDRFAVLFNFEYLAKNSGGEDYNPFKAGAKLVTVSADGADDEGKVGVQMLNSDRELKTRPQNILPLPKGDIMKSGGENALARYKRRLSLIQAQLLEFEQYQDSMMGKLDNLASREKAALLNF